VAGVRRLATVLTVLAIISSATDEQSPKPISRASATAIIANARKWFHNRSQLPCRAWASCVWPIGIFVLGGNTECNRHHNACSDILLHAEPDGEKARNITPEVFTCWIRKPAEQFHPRPSRDTTATLTALRREHASR